VFPRLSRRSVFLPHWVCSSYLLISSPSPLLFFFPLLPLHTRSSFSPSPSFTSISSWISIKWSHYIRLSFENLPLWQLGRVSSCCCSWSPLWRPWSLLRLVCLTLNHLQEPSWSITDIVPDQNATMLKLSSFRILPLVNSSKLVKVSQTFIFIFFLLECTFTHQLTQLILCLVSCLVVLFVSPTASVSSNSPSFMQTSHFLSLLCVDQ